MTDAEENLKVKSVSEVLLKSYRRRLTEQFSLVKAFRVAPAVHPLDGLKCKVLLMHTGSIAEFYIEPMLSCIGDTDVMYHYSNELAIPAVQRGIIHHHSCQQTLKVALKFMKSSTVIYRAMFT